MADNDNDLMPKPRQQQRAPFDMAFGDSIAAMQIRHGVGGHEGPQYKETRPGSGQFPAINPGDTASVGEPPSRVLQRLQLALQQNPTLFKGKRLFLSPGTSNNPAQVADIKQIFDTIKGLGDNAPASVVVPGVGPGVRGNQQGAVNTVLEPMVNDAGFKYYDPQGLKWQGDGVHPANALAMQAGAAQTIGAAPAAPAAPAPNQLAPQPTATLQPATFHPRYGNVIPYDASQLTKAIGVTQQQYDDWRSYLARRESAGYGQLPNGVTSSPVQLPGQTGPGYMGRYQMGTNEIVSTAHAMGIPVPSQQEFLGNPQLQEQMFEQYTLNHHNQLVRETPQYANANPQSQLAMLMGAHIGGVGGLQTYLATGQGPVDKNKVGVADYVREGYGALGLSGPQYAPAQPSTTEPPPPRYVSTPSGSGFGSGLPITPSAPPVTTGGGLEAPPAAPGYAATPDGSGYGTGLSADPQTNITRFAEPQGYTDYNPLWGHSLDPGTMRVGGAVGNVVQGQPQPQLPNPDAGSVDQAGGPSGAAAGQSQPPGQMTAKQMFALGLATGFRGVPISYDPWASLQRFPQERGRPSSYLGGLTPVSDPRISVPGVSYSPVSNPFFSVIRQPGRSGSGSEIAAQQASYGSGG